MRISEWYAKIYMQPHIFISFLYAIAFLRIHFYVILCYLQRYMGIYNQHSASALSWEFPAIFQKFTTS